MDTYLTKKRVAVAILLAVGASGCSSSRSEVGADSGSVAASSVQQTGDAAAGGGHDHSAVAAQDHGGSHGIGGHVMPGIPTVKVPAGASYTEADVHFMQGMIAHHAQAIHMSKMAPSRDANPRLARFAQKIDQSQEAEIALMQDWLLAHDQFAPDTSSWRTMHMPGMLTADELQKLSSSKGAQFDRLFLELMIKHHEGAIAMVKDLFRTPRSGQEVNINVFANEVEQVQLVEIELMRTMLVEMGAL